MGYTSTRKTDIRMIFDLLSDVYAPIDSRIVNMLIDYYEKYEVIDYSELLHNLYDLKQQDDQTLVIIQLKLEMLLGLESLLDMYERYMNEKYMHDLPVEVYKEPFEKFIKFLKKLENYFILEVARIRYSDEENIKIINGLESTVNEIKDKLLQQYNDFEKKSLEVERGLTNNVVTILGIFASFIIAFMGGVSIFGAVLEQIHTPNVFRLIFVLFLFGMIFFNVCFMLIYSMSKFVGRNIGSKVIVDEFPVYDDNYTFRTFERDMYLEQHHTDFDLLPEDKKKIREKEIKVNVKRHNRKMKVIYIRDKFFKYPMLFIFNALMIIGMMFTTIAYYNRTWLLETLNIFNV